MADLPHARSWLASRPATADTRVREQRAPSTSPVPDDSAPARRAGVATRMSMFAMTENENAVSIAFSIERNSGVSGFGAQFEGADRSRSPQHQAWQPERELRHVGHQHQHREHHAVERPDAPHHLLDRDLADRAADEEDRADRRVAKADA